MQIISVVMKVVQVIFLLTLLLLYSVAGFQVTQNPQQILYAKKSNSSQCPFDIQITECQMLDWFIEHFSYFIHISTKMFFEEGRHTLKNTILVDNCHNFTMTGNGSIGRSNDGLPQPTSIIYCDGNNTGPGLLFLNSSNISIKSLELKLCSGQYNHSEWYHVSASLIFDSVQNVFLDQVAISNAKGHALFIMDVSDLIYVVDSAFLSSSTHPNFSQSGNARFNFSAYVQHSFTSLVLESSWFMYGETSVHHSLPGGLIIAIACPNVTLVNVTAKGNTGGIGGNVIIFLMIFKVNSSNIFINNSCIMDGYAMKGGGLAFWSKQSQLGQEYTEYYNSEKGNNILTICNTNFHNNSATNSDSAMYISYFSYNTTISHLKHVTVTNSTFTENSGTGSSVDIVQHSLQPMVQFLKASLVLCNFTNDRLSNYGVAVVMIYSHKVSLTNYMFTGNNSTAISLSSCVSQPKWLYILFENNIAKFGGAMKVNEASFILINNDTHVHFINNRAEVKGGAIYVKTSCKDSFKSSVVCFVQPAPPPPYDIPIDEFIK